MRKKTCGGSVLAAGAPALTAGWGGTGYFAAGHEFLITPHNPGLILSYPPAPADLPSIGGPADQAIVDCIAQEIDIKTGKVLFQWDAAKPVPYAQSEQPLPAT